MRKNPDKFDVLVVGGGAAGLAAATTLARSRRKILLIDSGQQGNLPALHAHGVFTRDGTPPQELYEIARTQLLKYEEVTFCSGTVVQATGSIECFQVRTDTDERFDSRRLVLAQGALHHLPQVAGINELWGKGVWHCPLCDGYEAAGAPLLAVGDVAWIEDMGQQLPQWCNDISFVQPEDVTSLRRTGEQIQAKLRNGETLEVGSVVVQTTLRARDTLADQLGCRRSKDGDLVVNSDKQTSVAGVYAIGDQSSQLAQVNVAVVSGQPAAISINKSLGLSPAGAGSARGWNY